MKRCPFCAEEIQDAAIKCRYCGEFLDGARPPALVIINPLKWYYRTPFLVLAGLMVGPFMLPLILLHPKLTVGWKAGISLTIIAATIALSWSLYFAVLRLQELLPELESLL